MSGIDNACDRLVTLQRVRCFCIKSQQQIDRSTDSFYVSLRPTPLSGAAGTAAKWDADDKKRCG